MTIKKASAWSKHEKRAYTRKSKVKSKSYIKTIPPLRIQKFVMGDARKYQSNAFDVAITLVSKENVNIRDNAIEAARRQINRELDKKVGKANYYFSIVVYPHHVLRENKMLTGAGADRLQTGMQLSFGTPVGNAARVKAGKSIFLIATNKQYVDTVRKILQSVKSKLPCSTTINVELKK